MFRPGSVLWMLRHEVRLHWRGSKLGRWRTAAAVALAVAASLYHLPALMMARFLARVGLPVPEVLAGCTVLLAFAFVLMLSQGLKAAVDSLYERSDLDWLRTSPIPLRRVLLARMFGIAMSVVWPWLLFCGPVANAMAVYGHPEMLSLYPVLLFAALLATAIGAASTIVLAASFGLKRTRAISTALSMVTAAGAFLASQTQSLISPAAAAALWDAVRPECCAMPAGIGWWPGRAVLGDPVPLVALAIVGLGGALLASRLLERRFVSSAMVSASATRSGARTRTGSGALRFSGNLRWIMVRKELRLIARAPGLLGKAVYQLVYLVPLGVIVLRGTGEAVTAALATLPVFFMGELARLFMTTAITADGAAELAMTSPVPPRFVRLSKVAATCFGVAAIGAVPVLAVACIVPRLVPVMLAGTICVTVSEILLGLWKAPPGRRQDLGGRHGGFSLMGIVGTIISITWSSATYLALNLNPWAALPAALAVGLLVVMRL